MTIYYAKSTGGFYDTQIIQKVPADAVEVTAAEYAALFDAQASGKRIAADANGHPQAVDQVATLQSAQIHARAALAASDRVVLRCYEAAVPVPAEWRAYRVALRTVVGLPSGSGVPQIPSAPAYPANT